MSVVSDQVSVFAESRMLSLESEIRGPLIVLGLPRSGSSFLSDVISQVRECYVFDDLYLHRHLLNSHSQSLPFIEHKDLDDVFFFLSWQIRARLRFSEFAKPSISEDEIEVLNQGIKAAFEGKKIYWYDLQKEWLARLTLAMGAHVWGYKCPGDFTNISQLKDVYPESRFVYLIRNPENVLASYKNIDGNPQDGDAGQYHPIFYSLYWRSAVDSYRHSKRLVTDRVLMIKFEELIKESTEEGRKIARFIGVSDDFSIERKAPNTSFTKKTKKELTGLELKIIKHYCSDQLDYMGYVLSDKPIRISDFADILRVTFKFGIYQLKRIVQGDGRYLLKKLKKVIFKR